MVGKRTISSDPDRDANGHPVSNGDLESGQQHVRKRYPGGFKDAVNAAIKDRKRSEVSTKLKEGIKDIEFESFRVPGEKIEKIKDKKIRQFYEKQNELLDDWVEVDTLVMSLADDILGSMNPDADNDGVRERGGALQAVQERVEELLPEESRENRARANRNARWAINVNVLANILLLLAKVMAAFYSSSLSLIASLVDSALDLLCTVIIWSTNRLVQWRLNSLRRRFPVGRRRLEPLGILVFSVIMVISFFQILQESIQKLLPGGDHSVTSLPPVAIGAMAATIVVKGIIWFGCIRVKTSQVQALAQDCKTDVYFNTLSLLFPLIGGSAGVWWLDPVGAAILSLFIIYDWVQTCFENVTRLSGSAVDDRLQKKLTFLAFRFSPIVEGMKSIVAYHAGDGVWAEYDVLLDEKTTLHRSHDIAETLQYCAEGLVEVDRAFVTTDCEFAILFLPLVPSQGLALRSSLTYTKWYLDTSLGPTGHATDHA
ncbi:MAG: hypothetical protein Q9227_007365 [Pyrenula ochraceoflavens]